MTSFPEYKALNIAERILFVGDIWDSIASNQKSIETTPEQRKELDRRLESHEQDPGKMSPWSDIKSGLKKKN